MWFGEEIIGGRSAVLDIEIPQMWQMIDHLSEPGMRYVIASCEIE
jgi:hypothetical protein